MKVKAIICELNPPHFGHKEIIDLAKEDGSYVVALMSGNFVQRGSCSVFDKYDKAAMAVKLGVDLVLELPYPFSSSYAQSFASASIHILSSLGIVDELVFGCVNLKSKDEILKICSRLSSIELELLSSNIREKNPTLSQNQIRAMAYESIYGHTLELTANDILAVEYTQAIIKQKSRIAISPIMRTSNWSASESRKKLGNEGIKSLSDFMPNSIIQHARQSGISDEKLLGTLIRYNIISNSPSILSQFEGCGGGVAEKLIKTATITKSYQDFLDAAVDKTLTRATIRRRTLNMLFKVTESTVKSNPKYTFLLGANERGLYLLKNVSQNFIVITKPSSFSNFVTDETFKRQISLELQSDATYCLLQGKPSNYYLLQKPYIEN